MSNSAFKRREISTLLDRLLKQFPVVVVSGLRQTGKSTLLEHDEHLAAGRRYVTLDDVDVFALAKDDPARLLTMGERLAIDEVQRSPEVFVTIKQLVDQKRQPGRYVLSGSANLLLHQHTSDSLAGRAYYAYLRPLNRRERLDATGTAPALVQFLQEGRWPEPNLPPVDDREILRGGFPEVALHESVDQGLWFDAFERTYLERDVRDLRQIEDLVGFHRLLRLAALRVGGVLNIAGLARDAQLKESTTRRYLDVLETLMVIHRIPPYHGNRSSRLIKAAKLYLADSGLAARLSGVHSIGSSSADPMRGALLENFVLQNLQATLEPHLPDTRIYFWNEQGRREVDFIVETGAKTLAIEVKADGRIHSGDSAHLENFLRRTPSCLAGILAYQGSQLLPLRPKLWAAPLNVLLG